ncbi:MAG: hypothetical protein JSV88_16125 [Candidatus Aminicenantes bacterium]|nr:MAG: hypothetical protein JSV88_16125 [Candidatus Aminicenantes bacterium]
MRCEKQYFLKCLLIVLLVVMVAFLFQPGPANAQKGSIAQVLKITTEISSGLYTATLETPYGKINVNLPDDIAFGDIVAGTLYTSPLGKTKEEIAKNLDKLNSYVVEIEEIKDNRTSAAQKKNSWTIPKGIDAIHLVFKDKDNVQMARKEVPLSPKPLVYSPADFHLPTIGQAQELLHITGPFDGKF